MPQRPEPQQTVGFGPRVGARLIDMAVGYAMSLGAGVLAAIVLATLQRLALVRGGWEGRFGTSTAVNTIVGIVASVTGAALSTWLCGASVGKLILRMRVVRADGQRVGMGAAVVRELAYYVDGFFFGLVGKSAMDSTPYNRRHGDNWADTMVVHSLAARGPSRFTSAQLVIGLVLGNLAEIVIVAAAFIVAAA